MEDEVELLNENILTFLLENDLALCGLAHLPLNNSWLLKIYEKDHDNIEALQTVMIRYLLKD
jgi:hypothetical protein